MKTTTLFIGLTLAAAGTANGQCIQGDINGDGIVNGIDLAFVLQNWNETCPVLISSVTPSQGSPAGGTAITIVGEQLAGVQSVTIGGVPATSVVVVDATTVTAVTPPSKSLGPKDVVVTTPTGTATLAGGFAYSLIDWGTVLEMLPDPAVVIDPEWRERIIATGLPWRVRDNASQIEMLLIPPGTFMMGCSASDQSGCYSDEHPVHEVTLTQAFYLGRFEVTQLQWSSVIGSNPSTFQGSPDSPTRPVESVSWNAAQAFMLSTALRLPTEAEWEYACRAGTTTAFNNSSDLTSSLDALAWYIDNNGSSGTASYGTKSVGQKLPNRLGLFDMHGNVNELCSDWWGYQYYATSPPIDPQGPDSGSYRASRGGSWTSYSFDCRSSSRGGVEPASGYSGVGFRAARNP